MESELFWQVCSPSYRQSHWRKAVVRAVMPVAEMVTVAQAAEMRIAPRPPV
ncbi:hypothetical protein PAMC26577_09085 [Caballeronia sordidicola]|uniref:Uncharacterized protein n=1 Tax=Caballeronia sordidicola TaxID=196367 RepID=A0A242N0A1_CABSO|nr:hypothetical protein PAMC26577_09085 [Caballeronia sordidicola]